MLKPTTKQRVVSVAKIVITIGVVFGSFEGSIAREPQHIAAAPTSLLSSAKLTDLETAFWVCDYFATTRGVSDISACTAVYEALKDRKFAGDFDALVSWWRQNKLTQHQNIAVADSATQSAASKEGHHE
jgi:hypothetical protein